MAEQTIVAENVRWDLSVLYFGIDDHRIDEDVASLIRLMREFNQKYKGKLAEKLGEAVRDLMGIKMLGDKINSYLGLRQSLNTADEAVCAKKAEVNQAISACEGEYMAFFSIELTRLDEGIVANLCAGDRTLFEHKPWIRQERIFTPHLLSEEVEAALIKRSSVGLTLWVDLFNELEADLRFDLRLDSKTLTQMIHVLDVSKDVEERAEAMRVLNQRLGGSFAKYAAQAFYALVSRSAIERRERGFRHPMDVVNKSNLVPDDVVNRLHDVVVDVGGNLTRRYLRLKAAHLGMEKLRWSDRNAPMPFSNTSIISFDEAARIVFSAYESFSPTMAEIVRGFVSNGFVDAPAVEGKRGGAFNHSVILPGGPPVSFVLLNYIGSSKDVMILAHELGHGAHGVLAGRAKGVLMFEAPIVYAEIASTFSEMITFDFLKKRLMEQGDTNLLLALVMKRIEEILNTVVRQIGFSNFERRMHGMDSSYREWKEPRKISAGQLSVIWLETLKEIYGDAITYENTEYLWSYVSHFLMHFYVYGYAFAALVSGLLYSQWQRLGESFEPLYLDFLSSGSTRGIVELLQPFGLNPLREGFWEDCFKAVLEPLIEEAEGLSRNMGIIQ